MNKQPDSSQARSALGMIVSYVDAGGTVGDERKIGWLRELIKAETGIEVDDNYIKKKVRQLHMEMEKDRKRDGILKELYRKDLPEPNFRFGSAFCSKCRRFKNYSKECPFCNHLELSI